jgi:hypothetical protein
MLERLVGRALDAARQKPKGKKTVLRTQILQDLNLGQHDYLQVGSQGSGQCNSELS